MGPGRYGQRINVTPHWSRSRSTTPRALIEAAAPAPHGRLRRRPSRGRGGKPPEHVNDERDVLIFVAQGSATVTVDGEERRLAAGEGLIVDKGRRRKITAGAGGVRYLSVHLRRPPIEILPANRRSVA